MVVLTPPRPGPKGVKKPKHARSKTTNIRMLELATVAALESADNNTAHRGGAGSNERQVESSSGMTLPAAPAENHQQDVRGPSAATGARTSHDSAIPRPCDLFQNGVQSIHEAIRGGIQHGFTSGWYAQKNEMDRQKNELEQRNSERISELEQRNSERISELKEQHNSELERARVAEQQNNNDLRIELNRALVALQQKEDELESLEQTTNELQHLNNRLNDDKIKYTARINVLQNEEFKSKRQSREDQRAYDQLEADNNAKQEEIADLQRLCDERDEEIAGLKIDKVDLNDEVDRNKDRINELEEHLDAIAYHGEDPSGAILIDCD